jgi:hypothetical protein
MIKVMKEKKFIHVIQSSIFISILFFIPVAFLLLFAIGELAGGEAGWIHLIQLLPLLICIGLVIKFPKIFGFIIFLLSIGLSILYLWQTQGNFFPVIFILFLPPGLAGFLLWKKHTK